MEKDKKPKAKKTASPLKEKKAKLKKDIEEKEIVLEESAESEEAKKDAKPGKYFEAVGKRKTSVARVRLFTQGEKDIVVNDKAFDKYFPSLELQQIVLSSLDKMKCVGHFRVLIRLSGGGIHSQAEAARHGIARALVKFNPDFRKKLRRSGYITRDPRSRERKKFGLKRARRAPQWSKR